MSSDTKHVDVIDVLMQSSEGQKLLERTIASVGDAFISKHQKLHEAFQTCKHPKEYGNCARVILGDDEWMTEWDNWSWALWKDITEEAKRQASRFNDLATSLGYSTRVTTNGSTIWVTVYFSPPSDR